MLLFVIHYCLEMSLYHVYFSNDIFIVFIISVADMDHNAYILRVIDIWEILVRLEGVDMNSTTPC